MAQAKCSDKTALVLVDGDGNFNQNIGRDLKLVRENGRVTAVSIIGVQNTGKSTLMNRCLHTSFQEMNASDGPSKTTTGVMMAIGESPQNADYSILVIDTEGSDGAKGDDSFEKKTTLFALSVSNTVIFNMKYDSIDLRGGISGPLMGNVFEALVRKCSTPRQINLLFVIRDMDAECPLEKLDLKLREQLQKTWDELDSENAILEDYLKIDVMTMPHHKVEKNEFDSEVKKLREKINSLVEPCQLDPVSGFVALAETNWNDIKDDKILNISFNRYKMAEFLCTQILMEKVMKFNEDRPWIQIQKDVESGKVAEGFGKEVSTIIAGYISEYDKDTPLSSLYESHRVRHRAQLAQQLLKDFKPAYLNLARMVMDKTTSNYQKKIVADIRKSSSAFEEEVDEFISQYQTLMKDICSEQACWDPVNSEQLKRLKSELGSNREKGVYIFTQHTQLEIKKKELKAIMITGTVIAALGIAVCGVAVGACAELLVYDAFEAASAAVSAGGVPAVIKQINYISRLDADDPEQSKFFEVIMPKYNDYIKMKSELKENCRKDSIAWALYCQI